ncbi:MAG: DUF4230 domain-containing protein [Chlorobi bacterium]|nr:DUF4230 domain-containing protein [Chlorobiota bacterium]
MNGEENHNAQEIHSDESGVRRYHAEKARSPRRPPLVNISILIGIIALVLFLIWQFFFTRPMLSTEEFSIARAVEEIEEVTTVRSHLRFVVVVREESGNLIVRQLAEQGKEIDVDDIGSMFFHDPTLLAELHGVATYGVKLDDVEDRIEINREELHIRLPSAELLDIKVINADTRIIARMKGLFRSEKEELLLVASQRGKEYAEEFARSDSASLGLAEKRAQEIIRLLAEQRGKKAIFVEDQPEESL